MSKIRAKDTNGRQSVLTEWIMSKTITDMIISSSMIETVSIRIRILLTPDASLFPVIFLFFKEGLPAVQHQANLNSVYLHPNAPILVRNTL